MLAILAAVMIITGIPVSSFAVESSEAQCEFERNFLQNLGGWEHGARIEKA